MANTLLTPDVIAKMAYANLYENAVMAQLVHRDYESDFTGKVGDTVTIRKPATFTANEFDRTSGISIQNATETGIPVTLDTLLDVSFAVTAEQLTLDLVDFNEQLLQPATEAIVQGIDTQLLTLRADISQTVGSVAGEEWNVPASLIAAGRELSKKKVPVSQRYVVAGPTTEAEWLKDELFNRVDQSGSTQGLQEASIGRKFGFDAYMDQHVISGGKEDSVAFHRTAFALVMRTLALPQGSQNAAVFADRGIGIRVVQDYDITHKQDVISLDVLVGVKTLDANRACIIHQP
jgi:hypothetical protein